MVEKKSAARAKAELRAEMEHERAEGWRAEAEKLRAELALAERVSDERGQQLVAAMDEVRRLRAAQHPEAGANARLTSEVARLRGALKELQYMHRRADDDPNAPYCPECQAYDGTNQPCTTLEVVDRALEES